ncbi:GPI mannosyltransferase 1 [Aspergillus alliaceus]|uniref:GPI mannosyltransferase 1 n=1 Tax=Petromyces alliaceus TaxID=209559 RepID=A0A8H5ZTQ4_PETAA|nr:GPI mannosyltransferase 1 [Aspergillus burnettii]
MASLFERPSLVFGASIALRVILLFYGAWQDAHSAVKYTDIDYMVFTDAARYVSQGASPYARDTYRYTPLLAWMLLPTSWEGLFSFGKALFALSDVVAGWLIAKSLMSFYGMSTSRALKYASFWLLNPMVANISTRGSSEGLLGVLVIALLWAVLNKKITLAGVILGLSVHFKIYPFIYGPSIIWWLDEEHDGSRPASPKDRQKQKDASLMSSLSNFVTPSRLLLTVTALATFSGLNISMYILYGFPFAQQTYLHHLSRIDHRHNFSPYSTLLYLSAAGDVQGNFESLAFIPQLLLSVVVIPIVLAKKSLPGAMLAQTFAFVTFNKVCTSQYFLWYLVFLPFYLPSSSLMKNPRLGVTVTALWVAGQAMWLQQGYYLEFLGLSSFVPGLFLASLGFFAVNVWILGIIVSDVGLIGN